MGDGEDPSTFSGQASPHPIQQLQSRVNLLTPKPFPGKKNNNTVNRSFHRLFLLSGETIPSKKVKGC